MRRLMTAALAVFLVGMPAQAQDRLIQLGWLWDVGTDELTRLRPMPEFWSARRCCRRAIRGVPGSRRKWVGAPGVPRYRHRRSRLVPGVSLDWPDPSVSDAPALAADPRRSRVFIWHGRTIVEVSESSGVRVVVPDVEAPLRCFGCRGLSTRRLAYSAEADVVMFPQPGQSDPAIDDIVVARVVTGEIVRRFATVGTVSNLSADVSTARVKITSIWDPFGTPPRNSTLQVFDAPDGSVTQLPYAPPYDYGGPALDETNHRLLLSHAGGVVATDDAGAVLGELTTGTTRQVTYVTGVSAASGRTFVQSYFGGGTYITPGPCLSHVVERTGQALAPIDLSARVGRQDGRCGRGILLTPAGSPGVPVATINGRHVALSWTHPGNVEAFELEVRIGVAAIVWPVGADATTTFADVPPGTYGVRVRGRNAVGVGAWSALTAITVP
ncbi:MAG TPA: fibronectin type III domain-containing protein [Vicinamibacterales bacterium]|nr:fibronectin type III domain-containing protein [Vicinamibacterales bacterium]